MKSTRKFEVFLMLLKYKLGLGLIIFSLFISSCSEDVPTDDGQPEDEEEEVVEEEEEEPEEELILGYSVAELEAAQAWADQNTQTASVMVLVDGEVLVQWGAKFTKYISHSTRKSFMSALYGKYVADGTIDMDATMADLGIDDIPALSDQEKTATVGHCLQSISGVYHTAEAESEYMHDLKPDRDTYQPGTFWIYNNWDFNVLRTIFESQTGKNFYVALKEDIMDPIGANFNLTDSLSWTPTRSIHPAYMFRVSAPDMAKFGQLMLQNGNWNGDQVIPQAWVEESTKYYWDAQIYNGDGYGYMWWVATNSNVMPYLPNCDLPAGTYSARGAGGQWLEIIPERNMVFVHLVDTGDGDFVETGDVGTLLQMILDAKVD